MFPWTIHSEWMGGVIPKIAANFVLKYPTVLLAFPWLVELCWEIWFIPLTYHSQNWFNMVQPKIWRKPQILEGKNTSTHILATYLLLMIWFCFVVVVVWNGVEAAKSNGKWLHKTEQSRSVLNGWTMFKSSRFSSIFWRIRDLIHNSWLAWPFVQRGDN